MIARPRARPLIALAALLCCGAFTLTCSHGEDATDAGVVGEDGPMPGRDARVPDSPAGPACDPTFGQAQACGGKLEGTWNYVKACVPGNTYDGVKKVCKGATVSNSRGAAAGTIAFSKDGYVLDASVVMDADFTIGGTCLALLKTCQKVANAVKLLVPGSKVTCADSASAGCDCKITLTWAVKWLGKYSAAQNKVTLKTGQDYHYCVKGDVLRYRGVSTNSTDRTATYVLKRK